MEKYLNEHGFITENGYITIASIYDTVYCGTEDKFFSEGTRPIPMPLCVFPPDDMQPLKYQVIRWDGEKYYLDYDFRGKIFYSTETGAEIEIKELGAISDEMTDKKYPGQFYEWLGDDWVLNEAQKIASIQAGNQQHKASLLAHAKEQIEILQDELDLGVSDNEKKTEALLKAWKVYRINLNNIKKLSQENIVWLVRPEGE